MFSCGGQEGENMSGLDGASQPGTLFSRYGPKISRVDYLFGNMFFTEYNTIVHIYRICHKIQALCMIISKEGVDLALR